MFSSDFLQNLSSKTLNFPDRDDLVGSALALLRLQDVYALPTDQLAKGNVQGVAKSPDMTGKTHVTCEMQHTKGIIVK